AGERREQLHLPTGRAAFSVHHPAGLHGSRIKRVESDRSAWTERHWSHTPGSGQVAVLALGINNPGPSPENGLAPEKRLDEGALAPADLPEDHHVGVGHHALGVELEGVEDEGPTEEVV